MCVLAELGSLRKAEYFYTIIACSFVHHANMSNPIRALTDQMGFSHLKRVVFKSDVNKTFYCFRFPSLTKNNEYGIGYHALKFVI